MLIYVNITDRRTDRQTHQKYSSEPHKSEKPITLLLFETIIAKNVIITKKLIYAYLAFSVCEPL